MKIANLDGRLSLLVDGGVVDVHAASGGRFGPDPASGFARWDELRDWAADASAATGDVRPLDETLNDQEPGRRPGGSRGGHVKHGSS